jgi:hypothetical protein
LSNHTLRNPGDLAVAKARLAAAIKAKESLQPET